MSARARYARILRTPHVRPLILAALVARLPIGMDSLAIVLFLRQRTGSYAIAGVVAAAYALGAGAGQPLAARIIDRLGQRPVLLPMAALHVVALGALVGLSFLDAPAAVLVPVALLAGLLIPPVGATLRPLWQSMLRDEPDLVSTAYALDSVLVEMLFVLGPLLTAAATALLSPAIALGLSAALVTVGTIAFVSSPPSRDWRPEEPGAAYGWLGALRSSGLRTIVATAVPLGLCFGMMEVTLPAFSEDMAQRAWAGVLLSVWSLGSMLSGIAYGGWVGRVPLASTFVRLALALPLTFLPLAAAPSLWAMPALCLLAGVAIAPLLASAVQLAGQVAPPGALTEAFTWPITALVIGIALGNALAGLVVEAADWRVSFLVAAGTASIGGVLAFARRKTLAPAGVLSA